MRYPEGAADASGAGSGRKRSRLSEKSRRGAAEDAEACGRAT